MKPIALVLCVALAGCGVGGILAASAGGGGGGGGSSSKPAPPTASVVAPGGDAASNLVAFQYLLRDPQVKGSPDPGAPPPAPGEPAPIGTDPRVRIEAQYARLPAAPGAEDWRTMTEARVRASEGTRALALGQHTFVWNALVDLAGFTGRVRVRVVATYEDSAGIRRTFKTRDAVFVIDNRLAATIFGADVQPANDVDTFPVDMRPDGDAFLVACLGANIVERIDALGRNERVVGYGVPGDTVGAAGQNPGVVRLQTLVAFDVDAKRSVFTNHSDSLLVTNTQPLSVAPGFSFLGFSVPPQTTVRAGSAAPRDFVLARGARLHPSGVLLLANNPGTDASELRALNGTAAAVTLAGTTVAAGTQAVFAGGTSATTKDDGAPASITQLDDVVSVAVGPDGEIYYTERSHGRVRVVNPGAAALTIGGTVVLPGTVTTVAGSGTLGFAGDGGPAKVARLNLPGGIDVSPERVLFIADTSNRRVRMANLGPSAVTFAETPVNPGDIATAVGHDPGASGGGGVGSKAKDINLGTPNSVTVDANGNLLIADQHQVVLVNAGTVTVTSYGKTAGPARTASVYDATLRGGLPLLGPRAVHSQASDRLYFTDRTTVRVLNLGTTPAIVGGAEADPGTTAIVAGGAVPGFSGDGGSARSAAFANPSALASEGPTRIYVADTDNDRIRVINVNDPRLGTAAQTVFGVSVPSGAVATVAGLGRTMTPPPADGDGLAPTAAVLLAPQGVAVSNAGLLFVADTGHHRIRVMNPGPGDATVAGVLIAAGTIRTVVGGGIAGSSPDGPGPWLVSSPGALALDRDLLYFAESGNARIRVLNISAATVRCAGLDVPPSQIVTICGTGVRGSSGDGGLGPDARVDTPRSLFVQTLNSERVALYFADGPQNVVRVLNLTDDQDLVGAESFEGQPTVTIPARSVISLAGGPNSLGFPNPPSFAGDGEEASKMRFSNPFGVAVLVDPSSGRPAHLFVADEQNNRLRRAGAPPLLPRGQ
jgi:hypothetical protein